MRNHEDWHILLVLRTQPVTLSFTRFTSKFHRRLSSATSIFTNDMLMKYLLV